MKRAFTLIELLVVIAIVAILAAILFPVFAQAKAAAKKTACLSNLKQLGLAFTMYAGDHEDVFPLSNTLITEFPNGTQFYTTWYQSVTSGYGPTVYDPRGGYVYPYTRSAGVLDCPANGLDSLGGALRSYGLNVSVYDGCDDMVQRYACGDATYATPLSRIERTADTILLGDSAALSAVPTGSPYKHDRLDVTPYPYHGLAYGVHAGSANVAWCDGHARSMRVSPLAMVGTRGVDEKASEDGRRYAIGAIWRSPPPADVAAAYHTPALAQAAYYYLLSKPAG